MLNFGHITFMIQWIWFHLFLLLDYFKISGECIWRNHYHCDFAAQNTVTIQSAVCPKLSLLIRRSCAYSEDTFNFDCVTILVIAFRENVFLLFYWTECKDISYSSEGRVAMLDPSVLNTSNVILCSCCSSACTVCFAMFILLFIVCVKV